MLAFRRFLIVFALILGACSDASRETSQHVSSESLEIAPAPPPPPLAMDAATRAVSGKAQSLGRRQAAVSPGAQANDSPTLATTSMLIRTGQASVEVDSLEAAVAGVRRLTERVGGLLADASMQLGQHQVRSATLELRIPAERWDEVVGGLGSLGRVEAVNVQVEDVGEEFVDLTARLENARRYEQRMLELLANRTGKLEDVLAVERELARIREEIERMQGRRRYLETRVAVSRLSITVHEPAPLVGEYPGSNVIADAFRQAWRNFVGFIAAFIASLGVLVPLLVIVAVVGLALRWAWQRVRRRDT
jgi:hypothetical protein